MRLDRTVSLILHHAQMLKSRADVRNLPILMYHSISRVNDGRIPYFVTTTHPGIFAQHMRLLKEEGYVGVTLTQGLQWLNTPGSEASRAPVVITFDDGLRDYSVEAVPVLRDNGFRATMYLPTGYIDKRRSHFNGRECLTWSEIRELHADGFEFGSHTVTHPRLVDLGWESIETELKDSKASIEDRLQCSVKAFAYPYAFPQERKEFVRRLTNVMRETGYDTCVTTTIGRVAPGADTLSLRRLPANSCDDPSLFRAKLQGAYDWLAAAQAGLKRMKHFRRVVQARSHA